MDETNEKRVIEPDDGSQKEFLSLNPNVFECWYGGAAGPGKTWSLVADVLGLQFEYTQLGVPAYKIPQYRGYLFRRTTKRLPELIDMTHEYYPLLGARYITNRVGHPGPAWIFPSWQYDKYRNPILHSDGTPAINKDEEGAKIFLCHMQLESDKFSYHGIPIHYAGFDELPEFLLSQYTYIFSRCRSTIEYLIARCRATGNPVGIGIKWVRERFRKNLEPHKIYYFVVDPVKKIEQNPQGIMVPEGTKDAVGRVFIPGRLEENKHIVNVDQYRANIKQMGNQYAKALLEGDIDAFQGQALDMLSRDIHEVDPFFPGPEWRRYGGMDYGNVTCAHIICEDPETGDLYVEWEWVEIDKERQAKADSFWIFLNKHGCQKVKIKGDTNMFAKMKELPKVAMAAKPFKDKGVDIEPIIKGNINNDKFRVGCVREVKDLLGYELDENGMWIRQPRLYFMRGRCPLLFESLFDLVPAPDNEEDIAGEDDHYFDSLKMAIVGRKQYLTIEQKTNLLKKMNEIGQESVV